MLKRTFSPPFVEINSGEPNSSTYWLFEFTDKPSTVVCPCKININCISVAVVLLIEISETASSFSPVIDISSAVLTMLNSTVAVDALGLSIEAKVSKIPLLNVMLCSAKYSSFALR